MRIMHRVGAALAAATLLATGITGPAAADLRPLTDDERAAAREKATRARSASEQPQDGTFVTQRVNEKEPRERTP
ncbi:hypothetical protein [Kocuria sp. CPCC 205263]|uniref:hypothetical protein n=1 Tax=Kocuria sp. CPCC 205263 TaxID=3073555 RepID=UPI0034D55B53